MKECGYFWSDIRILWKNSFDKVKIMIGFNSNEKKEYNYQKLMCNRHSMGK